MNGFVYIFLLLDKIYRICRIFFIVNPGMLLSTAGGLLAQ
jgi:hypothetical protein